MRFQHSLHAPAIKAHRPLCGRREPALRARPLENSFLSHKRTASARYQRLCYLGAAEAVALWVESNTTDISCYEPHTLESLAADE